MLRSLSCQRHLHASSGLSLGDHKSKSHEQQLLGCGDIQGLADLGNTKTGPESLAEE
jgi:hypothetical protein